MLLNVRPCAIVLSILKPCYGVSISLCFRLCYFRESYNLGCSKVLPGISTRLNNYFVEVGDRKIKKQFMPKEDLDVQDHWLFINGIEKNMRWCVFY